MYTEGPPPLSISYVSPEQTKEDQHLETLEDQHLETLEAAGDKGH